jgi:hypothetical protein
MPSGDREVPVGVALMATAPAMSAVARTGRLAGFMVVARSLERLDET